MLQYLEHEVGPKKPQIRVINDQWMHDSFIIMEFDDFLKLHEFFKILSLGQIQYIGNEHLDEVIEKYIKERELGSASVSPSPTIAVRVSPSPTIAVRVRDVSEGTLFEYDGEIFVKGALIENATDIFSVKSISNKIFKQSIGKWVYKFHEYRRNYEMMGDIIVKLLIVSPDSQREVLNDIYNETEVLNDIYNKTRG